MDNPMGDIEDKKSQIDLGVMAARVFQGALDESGSMMMAYLATTAFFRGMFESGKSEKSDDS